MAQCNQLTSLPFRGGNREDFDSGHVT